MSHWIIEDWMGKHCYIDKKFNSFEEARDFISEVANNEAMKQYPNDTGKNEDLYNGICEDLYATEVTENE